MSDAATNGAFRIVHPATAGVAAVWMILVCGIGLAARGAHGPPPPTYVPPPTQIAPPPTQVLAPPPTAPVAPNFCGAPGHAPRHTSDWASYSCRERDHVGIGWPSCLGWRSYGHAASDGCPGDMRCCPAGPLAGAAPVPGELCVHDPHPPLAVRDQPASDAAIVDQLENGTHVWAESATDAWMTISAPRPGFVWLGWLQPCDAPGDDHDHAHARTVDATDAPPVTHEAHEDDAPAPTTTPPTGAPEGLNAVRAALAQGDLFSAVRALDAVDTSTTTPFELASVRAQVARLGGHRVGALLTGGNCDGARALYRALDRVGASAEAGGRFTTACPLAPAGAPQ